MKNEKMMKALNMQVNRELYSSYLYLSMAAYFEEKNLKGFAEWMRLQSEEETMHGMKIYDYILEIGGSIKLLSIEAPDTNWKSPEKVFEAVYKHEQIVTKMIHDLVALAIDLKDYATNSFLQWFVNEQVEEEANASEILEKLKMAGNDPVALMYLDAEVGKRSASASAAEKEL